MKKIILVLLMVLALTVPVFACADPPCDVDVSQKIGDVKATVGNVSATGGNAIIQSGAIKNTNDNSNLNINTNVFDPKNTFNPTNTNRVDIKNTNSQSQKQGQVQGQTMNNKQIIAPAQTVLFESPTPLLSTPSQSVPELSFGTGRIKDITATMPNFALFGIEKYNGEKILKVAKKKANVKFKNYFEALINDATALSGEKGFKSSDYRIIVYCAEAQKTWTTGGNFGSGGSVLSATGLTGGSSAGSIMPQFGGTKADDLISYFYVKVVG